MYDALYARQSLDKKDSISIESQFNFCLKEVPEGTDYKKYKDQGYSGKNIKRPAFQNILKDIRKGLVRRVIVYRLDRLSRSLLDFAELMDIFQEYNVDFVSATEKFDTSTPIGKAMLSIVMVFAELERETIQQRITDNYYERGKKGMSLGGNPPFGFELAPTKIDGNKTNMFSATPDIKHIKELFERYSSSNVSLHTLAFDMNNNEIKTAFGNAWDSAKISRLIKNPAYVKADVDIYNYFKSMGCIFHNEITEYVGENGLYVYGNNASTSTKFQNLEGYHVTIAPHKGIVSSKTWLKCQHKLSKNKQIKNSGKSKYSWLSGLTKCKKCGYSMNINKGPLSLKNETYAIYFRCSGRALRQICDSKSTRVEEVEKLVADEIFDYVNTFNNTLQLDAIREDKKINELKMSISNIENEIENLIDNLASAKGAAMKYINKRIEKLDGELNILQKQFRELSQSDVMNDKVIVELKEVLSVWDELDIEDKKRIANKLINRVYIDKTDDDVIIKIDWKY